MKLFLALIFFVTLQFGYSQASVNYTVASLNPVTEDEKLPTRVSVVSPNRDTLWLIDHQIGRLIASTWDNFPVPIEEKQPVIIFTKVLPAPRSVSLPIDKKRKKKSSHKSGQASL